MYQVVIPQRSQKDLQKIELKHRLKIRVALIKIAQDPFLGKKLEGRHSGKWSYRLWPYRIIYIIKKQSLIVLVIRIGYRQGVY